eukprot:7014689-Pyramimonas_sp.AAC.1
MASSSCAKCRVNSFACCSPESSTFPSEPVKDGIARAWLVCLLVAGQCRNAAFACCHAATWS